MFPINEASGAKKKKKAISLKKLCFPKILLLLFHRKQGGLLHRQLPPAMPAAALHRVTVDYAPSLQHSVIVKRAVVCIF